MRLGKASIWKQTLQRRVNCRLLRSDVLIYLFRSCLEFSQWHTAVTSHSTGEGKATCPAAGVGFCDICWSSDQYRWSPRSLCSVKPRGAPNCTKIVGTPRILRAERAETLRQEGAMFQSFCKFLFFHGLRGWSSHRGSVAQSIAVGFCKAIKPPWAAISLS